MLNENYRRQTTRNAQKAKQQVLGSHIRMTKPPCFLRRCRERLLAVFGEGHFH
jgi:hypothetical protein